MIAGCLAWAIRRKVMILGNKGTMGGAGLSRVGQKGRA